MGFETMRHASKFSFLAPRVSSDHSSHQVQIRTLTSLWGREDSASYGDTVADLACSDSEQRKRNKQPKFNLHIMYCGPRDSDLPECPSL